MSTDRPVTGPAETPEPPASRGDAPAASPPKSTSAPAPSTTAKPAGKASYDKSNDPLRRSRASGFWGAVVLLVVVLVLLAIFVLQNTQRVEVRFLGWTTNPPLAAALLIAVVAALVLAVAAGGMRILQLRRRIKQERKR